MNFNMQESTDERRTCLNTVQCSSMYMYIVLTLIAWCNTVVTTACSHNSIAQSL